jgi:ParB/RepB/Spo0J family partition protein
MLKSIEVSKIKQGKNIRTECDAEIHELAESIEKQGLINPILVQKLPSGDYEVIAGHRRFEAVKRIGLPYIECNVVEDDLSEREVILTQIAENVQRKNMSAFELVETFNYLKDKLHINQKLIAKMFGKSDVWVTNQYQAVRMLEAEYGKDIPEDEKKKTVAEVKKDIAQKMGKGVEWIYCKGMKVKVVGHTYTLFPTDNKAENALRKFLESRK